MKTWWQAGDDEEIRAPLILPKEVEKAIKGMEEENLRERIKCQLEAAGDLVKKVIDLTKRICDTSNVPEMMSEAVFISSILRKREQRSLKITEELFKVRKEKLLLWSDHKY